MTWLTRGELPAHLARDKAKGAATAPARGALLVGGIPGEGCVPVSREGEARIRTRSASLLAAAGLAGGERVLVSLNSDGDLAGARIAQAAVEVGAEAAVVGARGRMRTLAAVRSLRPNVWITTPTGALDFLARLYLEFNVDPIELELDRIFVVGEIPTPGTARRLADEFEARVTGLYCDPIFGGLWAFGRDGRWGSEGSGVLGCAAIARDELVAGSDDGVVGGSELVLRPDWEGPLTGATIRTGQIVAREAAGAERASLFDATVGDHVLVRGRWLSLPLLRRGLAAIDGCTGLEIVVERGEGTLDKLAFTLAFARPSLVENPMWAGRAREAIAAVTPVDFTLATVLAGEDTAAFSLVDRRGHHLGVDRARLERPS